MQQLNLDELQENSSSFLSCDEEIKPIGSEMNISSGNESRMSLSMTMSSFRSIESSESVKPPSHEEVELPCLLISVLFNHAVSFDSPMLVSSPDVFASKFQSKKEFTDIDLVEDSSSGSTGEYASDIFSYLREAEVSFGRGSHPGF